MCVSFVGKSYNEQKNNNSFNNDEIIILDSDTDDNNSTYNINCDKYNMEKNNNIIQGILYIN